MPLAVEDEIYIRNFLNDPDRSLFPLTTVSGSATLNFGVILDGESATLTIPVTGAIPGDAVALGAPAALEADLIPSAFVSATNVVEVRLLFMSKTGATSINPAAGVYKATVFIV